MTIIDDIRTASEIDREVRRDAFMKETYTSTYRRLPEYMDSVYRDDYTIVQDMDRFCEYMEVDAVEDVAFRDIARKIACDEIRAYWFRWREETYDCGVRMTRDTRLRDVATDRRQ